MNELGRRPLERWGWLLAGAGAALYALRLGLEVSPRRPWWGVGPALCGLLIAWLLRRRGWAPLLLLWVYVPWPAAAPGLALGLGTVALAATAVSALAAAVGEGPRRARWLPAAADAGVGAGFLALYVATLAPTILAADSGEFQIVGPLLGVAHPPGYAAFTMLAKLFSLLPWGEVAWRLNLMGAVTGALTLVVVARTARRVAGGQVWAGLAAAAALGVSTTFWAQSTTINIRMLSMLSLALCLYFLARFLSFPAGSPQGARALTGWAASWGLAVAHTAWPAFFAPLFAAVIVWHDPRLLRRVRWWPRLLLAFAVPFASDLYIVARALTGAPFGTEELVDAGRVVDHLLGRGFGGDMFAYLRLLPLGSGGLCFLGERFLVMGNIFRFQFQLPLLAAAGLGFLALARRRKYKEALLLGGMWAIMTFIVATYRAPQSVEYLMPAYLPIALSIGYAVSVVDPAGQRGRPLLEGKMPVAPEDGGAPPADGRGTGMHRERPRGRGLEQQNLARKLEDAGQRRPSRPALNALLLAVLLLPILALGQANLLSYRLLHHDRSARVYAEAVLLDAPPGAHILSNWHWYTPLRYLQLVEGQRPDVEVTYLYPQGATAMPQAWPQRIAQELARSERPLIVTNYYPTYADLPYRFEPHGEAYRVRPGPSDERPADMVPLGADGAGMALGLGGEPVLRVLGYRRPLASERDAVEPGGEVSVDLVWQPLGRLEGGYATFVHLVGEDGVPLGQQDRQQSGGASDEPGEVRVERYRFPVHLTAEPGAYRLIAGAYVTHADGSWQRMAGAQGEEVLSLAAVTIAHATVPPVSLHPLRVPFGGAGPTLVGVDYDDTLPEQRRVYLHWQAGRDAALARLWAGEQVVAQGRVPAGPEAGREPGYVSTALDVPPGTRELRVEVWSADGTQAFPRRGPWGLGSTKARALPRPRPQQAYVPFGAKMVLVDAKLGGDWQAGREARVALRFVAQRPVVRDYVVSVGVLGEAATDAPSDWVPALGAIPTFKWVRGARVRDVHLIQVQDGSGTEVEVTVGVYDAFTTAALPPLDERIARLGRAGVSLGRVKVR